MSKYAVIEIGGKQEKVSVGDTFETVSPAKIKSLVPLLLSLRKGSLVSDQKKLEGYKVELKLVKDGMSKKYNIFQYKAKTGNRRRLGYRHPVYTYEVASIEAVKNGE